jgi:hypothetical protein
VTFYVKRPGQVEGVPVDGREDWLSPGGSLGALEDEWSLHLPHQCGAWEIGYGTREETLAEAREFRDRLDEAIRVIEAAVEE